LAPALAWALYQEMTPTMVFGFESLPSGLLLDIGFPKLTSMGDPVEPARMVDPMYSWLGVWSWPSESVRIILAPSLRFMAYPRAVIWAAGPVVNPLLDTKLYEHVPKL